MAERCYAVGIMLNVVILSVVAQEHFTDNNTVIFFVTYEEA
jgi:hypothetical protein